jgi:BON domain
MRRSIFGLAIAAVAVLSPGWLLAGDQDLADQIGASLKNSGKMHGYSIKVNVQGTTVWLNGSVRSQEQLATALDIVQDAPGIEKIVNGLTVREGAAAPGVRQTSGDSYGGQEAANASYRGSPAPLPLAAAGGGTPAMLAGHIHGGQPMPMPANMAQSAPSGQPIPAYVPSPGGGVAPAHFDHAYMPGYAWPSYASYPNYAALTYPRQYSPTAWPFIGPFYPYPQVPLGWRKVTLEWHNGWWNLDFNDGCY